MPRRYVCRRFRAFNPTQNQSKETGDKEGEFEESDKESVQDEEERSAMFGDMNMSAVLGFQQMVEEGGEVSKDPQELKDIFAVREEQAGKFTEDNLFELINGLFKGLDIYISTVTAPHGASSVVGFTVTIPAMQANQLCNLPKEKAEGWVFYDPTDKEAEMPAKLVPIMKLTLVRLRRIPQRFFFGTPGARMALARTFIPSIMGPTVLAKRGAQLAYMDNNEMPFTHEILLHMSAGCSLT